MFLIFCLNRPDVWPVDDFGVRKAIQIAYGLKELPTKKEMTQLGEKWRPWCSSWKRRCASWKKPWKILSAGLADQTNSRTAPHTVDDRRRCSSA